MIRAMFDGGCIPNPLGHCACACLISEDAVELYRFSRYIGKGQGMTNNIAEYEGLMLILRWIEINKPPEIHITGDSQVVINRMNRPKGYGKDPIGVSAGLALRCVSLSHLLKSEGVKIHYHWRGREENEECDAMCDLVIQEQQLEHEKIWGYK